MLVQNIGNLACVPGVFVGAAGLKNFSLFWPRETLGERIKVQKLPLPILPFLCSPQLSLNEV